MCVTYCYPESSETGNDEVCLWKGALQSEHMNVAGMVGLL